MDAVTVNDVGPRDGLQNQPRLLEPADRARLVRALLAAGLRHVEAGAFVSPKAVPAMAGSDAVLAELGDVPGATLTVLVPNVRGYDLARAAGARSVCMVLYGSEGMAQANVRMSRAGAEEAAGEILRRAAGDGVRVTAAIAVAFACPYDGPTDPGVVEALAGRLLEQGADEVSLADTVAAADPGRVRALTARLAERFDATRLSCHFHDTRALGLANVFAALESGIRKFDASIAGLGGCPFAPGASGNVATEDVAMLLEMMGFETGIDLDALMRAAELAKKLTGTAPGGRAGAWIRQEVERRARAAREG